MGCILAEIRLREVFIKNLYQNQIDNIFYVFGNTIENEEWIPKSLRLKYQHEGQPFEQMFDDDVFLDLLKKLMSLDPVKRPTAEFALLHRFLQ